MMDPLGQAGGPPPSISLPGGDSGTPTQMDSKLQIAEKAMTDFISGESDPEDAALASQILNLIHKLGAAQQKLVDTATGAGPGAKLVRKATAGGGTY